MSLKPTYQLVVEGIQVMMDSHAAHEKAKLGILRAGNTGLVLPTGEVAGRCPRQSLLRLRGIEAEAVNMAKEFMFGAGRGNEDLWMEKLKAAGISADRIKREEEIPISWQLPSGRLVTGRPDIVILDVAGKPERCLELKLVSSLWTARDVALKREPKTVHLLQASHYAWQLNCPTEIWYVNRTNFALPSDYKWGEDKKWPRTGKPGSEYFRLGSEGYPISMEPFIIGYELMWTADGELKYRHLGANGPGVWVSSVITLKGIQEFYALVDKADRDGTMPPRPLNITGTGEKGGFNLCDYCALKGLCDKAPADITLQSWMDQAALFISRLPKKGSL